MISISSRNHENLEVLGAVSSILLAASLAAALTSSLDPGPADVAVDACRTTLTCLKVAGTGFLVVWCQLLALLYRCPNLLYAIDRKSFENFQRIEFVVDAFLVWLPWLIAGLASIWGLMALLRRMSFLPFVLYRFLLGALLLLGSPLIGLF